jgi:tRNA G18 (ribose-2'-O)-methylase SpoU
MIAAMPVRLISDPHDPALADFRALTDVAARSAREPELGLFIAEGAKVIIRALGAGLRPRRVLASPRWYDETLASALAAAGHCPDNSGVQAQDGHPGVQSPRELPGERRNEVEVLLAPEELLREVTGYRVHRGALASFERPEPPAVQQVLARAGTIAVLVDLVDHTNVGAIFRNAAALGVDGILVTARCADPWYRRSIKVSMGAVFAVPWTVLPADHRADPVGLLHEAGLATYALTPEPGAADIRKVSADDRPRALLIGTEGPGLPTPVLTSVGLRVRIPMHHGVDSLNVGAASAIAFHHFAGRELA